MAFREVTETVQEETLSLSENSLRVLRKRYLAKNESGAVRETPAQMFRRVARNIAQVDRMYRPDLSDEALREVEDTFYGMMTRLEFLPNSPTLMNAGRDLQQLSACFVLPVEDSMEGIFESVKHAAIIHKSGGGTGFSFSRLRPKNDVVRTTGGVASGPVSFMKVFNHATEAVKQGGTRRGANMGILQVDHPDILEFITCKTDTRELTNFNISVAITDAFMEAVQRDETYPLINPRTGQVVRHLSAREVLDRIARQAWLNGEPGLFFIDRANEANPTPHVGRIEATNPCGEQPLLPYESCNLGSINLERHLTWTRERWEVDWARLERTIRQAVCFLDNVIDANRYPIPEIEARTKGNRKIGLGIMGFARMLFRLEIPYDSEEGLEMARRIMRFIRDVAYDTSARLAETRGVFPHWEGSVHARQGLRLRNACLTTVAPTGTLSMIADTSGGCEPEFSLIWYKQVMDGQRLPYVLEDFIRVAKTHGFWSERLLDRILENHGSVRGLSEVPEHWQRVYATAHDVSPEWHVRMQAAFQEFTDSAISKTINLPASATVEDVRQAYLLAYRLGCKGITVYRDGSREGQVLNVGTSQKETVAKAALTPAATSDVETAAGVEGARLRVIQPRPRPKLTRGLTNRMKTSCGDLYVTINEDEQGAAFEVFCNMGKAGGCEGSQNEAIGRLISLAFRSGIAPHAVIKQLIGIRCNRPYGIGRQTIHSCSDAIAKALLEYLQSKGGEESPSASVQYDRRIGAACPDCGCEMEFSEGCEKCPFCGHTKCY